MKIITTATNLHPDKKTEDIQIDLPSKCPHCDTAYGEKPIASYCMDSSVQNSYRNFKSYSLFFCPHCERCFFIEYYVSDHNRYVPYLESSIRNIYPVPASTTKFKEEIRALSPMFVKIYNQAEISENSGCLEICGLGYRKALEFLVKDYAIKFNPDDEESIKKQMLSPCINHYIDNPRIKTLATASAWIGNDETHYIRKHDDYDLHHLKTFIAALVSHIDSEFSYLKAVNLLNKGNA